MPNLLHLGCQTVADMIRGRSPTDVRMRLNPGSHQTAESSIIDFPSLSENVRVMCYDCFGTFPDIIMSFCQATQTKDGKHNLFSEFQGRTRGLLAITSRHREYLSQLAPNHEVVLYHQYEEVIHTNVDGRPRKEGDHNSAESWWRPSQSSVRGTSALLIGPIEFESDDSHMCSGHMRYLVICRRKELANFSRNWIMFWPTTRLVVRQCGDIWNLDGALSLFKGIKPSFNVFCKEKRGHKLSGTLTNEEIFEFLERIENKDWSGYPAQICLEQSLELIDKILKWHKEPSYAYLAGSRLEAPLLNDDRRRLEEVRARVEDQVKSLNC